MSVQYVCDGTGKVIEGKAEKRGFVLERHYDAEFVPLVDEYMTALDELHDKAAAQWQKGLAKLREDFLKEHPEAKLPDVPDVQ